MNVSNTQENAPKTGSTFLSAKTINGSVYIVDQDGNLVNGLISCSAESSVDDSPVLSLSAYSYDVEKPQSQPDE